MANFHVKIIAEGTLKDDVSNARSVLAKQVSKMAQILNKRLERLEQSGLTGTSAFRAWESQGRPHYGVRGLNFQQLQSEYWKIKQIMDNQTSTVRGAKVYIKKTADALGFDVTAHADIQEQQQNISNYFSLMHKVEEYFNTLEGYGYNIGSPQIQNMISDYIKTNKPILSDITQYNDALESIIDNINSKYDVSPQVINWHVWIEQ